MRDDLMRGVLATAVAALAVIVCCGGAEVLLAGLTGAVGGWLSGLGGIAAMIVAAGAALAWRSLWRRGARLIGPGAEEQINLFAMTVGPVCPQTRSRR